MNEYDTKPWWRSSTIWAAGSAGLVSLSGFIGDVAGLGEQIERLITVGCALYAIYGRFRADKRIGGRRPPEGCP